MAGPILLRSLPHPLYCSLLSQEKPNTRKVAHLLAHLRSVHDKGSKSGQPKMHEYGCLQRHLAQVDYRCSSCHGRYLEKVLGPNTCGNFELSYFVPEMYSEYGA